MEEIALLSGIPRSTLYYRYGSKAEILRELIEAMLIDLRVSVSHALTTEGPAIMKLRAVVGAQLQHLESNPALSRSLLTNLGNLGDLVDLVHLVDLAFIHPVKTMFDDGRRDGSLVVTDPELASEALYGAVVVIGLRRLMANSHIEVDDLATGLVDLVTNTAVAPSSVLTGERRRRTKA